jgi:predicted metal-dependent hydrolase
MPDESLPHYRVRVSSRARRVRLVVSAREGLTIVVPRRFTGDTDAIVRDRLTWVERALGKVAEKHAAFAAGAEGLLPDTVEFVMTGEVWRVEYRTTFSASVRVLEEGPQLVVSGAVADADACLAALSRWLDRAARERLLELLDAVSSESHIAYTRGRVARQRTRWGSCSARGTVSLNRNLVFVPAHLARSVVLHELAHTMVMNHSASFWQTLERYDRDALAHRRELRGAGSCVPPWADA